MLTSAKKSICSYMKSPYTVNGLLAITSTQLYLRLTELSTRHRLNSPLTKSHFVLTNNLSGSGRFPPSVFYKMYGETGNKKLATCFATLLQNELNSDVAR